MQKKVSFVLILTVLLLLVGVSAVAASPIAAARYPALESLTAYFPSDALAYAALRSDGDYIESVDTVVNSVVASMRELDMIGSPSQGPDSLHALLDAMSRQFTNRNFQTAIRPWLGDVVGAGVIPYFDRPQVVIVISITDQTKVVSTIEDYLAEQNWIKHDESGYTQFTQNNDYDRSTFTVFPEALLISSGHIANVETQGKYSTDLSASPYYNDTLALLPENNYDIIAYVDTPMLLATFAGQNYSYSYNSNNGLERLLTSALIRLIGPTAFGFTLGDNNSLTLDAAQAFGNKAGLDAMGITIPGTGQTIDPDFLANIPSDSIIVAQGANLNNIYEFSRDNLAALINLFNLAPEDSVEGFQAAEGLNRFPEILFSNFTGLTYETDVQPWVSSDYAFYGTLNPAYNPTSYDPYVLPFEAGLIFKSSDAAAAAGFITKLARELPITLRTLGDRGSVQVRLETLASGATGLALDIYPSYYSYTFDDDVQPVVQLLIGANDSLVVFGTRASALRILNGEAGGFQPELPNPLANTGLGIYANMDPLREVANQWAEAGASEYQYRDIQRLSTLFSGATFSVAGTANGDLLARLTLTFR